MAVAWGWERGTGESVFHECGVSVGEDENVLEIDTQQRGCT